jgi:hypothetical protein
VVQEGMTLKQVLIAMLALMKDENANQHRMGQLYNYTVKNKLAQKENYKDARDYFSKNLADLSQAALTMYGTVALHFSEQVARQFGVTCLSLLLSYKVVAELKVNHEEPGSTPIEVPADNGQVSTKPFGECSVEDMRKALRHKRKPSSSKPVPEQYLALADQYEQAVSNHFPKGVLIQVGARNQKGDSVFDIKGIPPEQMARMMEALMSETPPVPELLPPMPQVPLEVPPATVS